MHLCQNFFKFIIAESWVESKKEETEDAYLRYATSKMRPPRTQEKAYRVRGTVEPFYTLNVIGGIMSTSEIHKKAKWYGASITEYLNAVLLYALIQKQKADRPIKERPVKLAMPVNLRPGPLNITALR